MENVTSVRNLGHRVQMRIVPDPEFAPFKGTPTDRISFLLKPALHLSQKVDVSLSLKIGLWSVKPNEQPKKQQKAVLDALPSDELWFCKAIHDLRAESAPP